MNHWTQKNLKCQHQFHRHQDYLLLRICSTKVSKWILLWPMERTFSKSIQFFIKLIIYRITEDPTNLKYPLEFLEEKARIKKTFEEKQKCSVEEFITNRPSATDRERFDKTRKLKEEDQIEKIRKCVDAYYASQEPPENLREDSEARRSNSRSPPRDHKRSRSPSRSPSPRRRQRSSSNSSRSSGSSSRSSSSSRKSSPERGRDSNIGQRGYGGGGFSERFV